MYLNQLPPDYSSWFKFLIENHHRFEEINEAHLMNLDIDLGGQYYKIEKEYMCARAMEELIPHLPNKEEFEALFYSAKNGALMTSGDKHVKGIDFLFEILIMLR